jgi:hypothetical protein
LKRDINEKRNEILYEILELSERQLHESVAFLHKSRAITLWAKSPKDRTAINIIIDDQRKVIKALERLSADLKDNLDQHE